MTIKRITENGRIISYSITVTNIPEFLDFQQLVREYEEKHNGPKLDFENSPFIFNRIPRVFRVSGNLVAFLERKNRANL